MGNANSPSKSSNSAASTVPQTDHGVGIAAAAGEMIAGLSISSAGENCERAAAKSLIGEEVQNTPPAENRSREESKDTPEEKIRFPIRRGQRDCSSFVQTGNCKFGPKCWYNHPQQSANTLRGIGTCTVSPLHQLPPGSTMGNVNSQPKSTNNAASPVPQTDGFGIAAAAAGHMISGPLIFSSSEYSDRAAAKNLNGEEEKNTLLVENRRGEEAKDISDGNIRLPIRHSQRDCSSFVQTGNCNFGSKCWFNHPQRSANNLRGMDAYILPPLCQLQPRSTMGYVNSQSKSTNSDASPLLQTDDGVGIAAASENSKRATAKNLNGEEVQNTSSAENQSGEEAKDTSEEKIQFPIRRGQRDCSSFVQTGNCKFGSKCWYNHPQRSANNL